MSVKSFVGKVVSTKMEKTVVVVVEIPKTHAVYGKKLRWTNKFKAHDELEVKEGDKVKIVESSPFSKEVCWQVVEIVESN